MAEASTSTAATTEEVPLGSKPNQERIKNLFFLGDALLELHCTGTAEDLSPYHLQEDQKSEYTEAQTTLFEDVSARPGTEKVLGGSMLKSALTARWILQDSKSTVSFAACVGNDKTFQVFKDLSKDSDVKCFYDVREDKQTGSVASIVTSSVHRTECTKLDKEIHFRRPLLKREDVSRCLKEAAVICTDGIFFSHSSDIVLELAEQVAEQGQHFAFNLSAEYIVERHSAPLLKFLPFVDILIGGKKEIIALVHIISPDIRIDIASYAVQMIANYKRDPRIGSRLVMCTDGANVLISCISKQILTKNEVPVTENIVDTVGARDAFLGAFLAVWLQLRSVGNGIYCGLQAAQLVLQKKAFELPTPMPDDFKRLVQRPGV